MTREEFTEIMIMVKDVFEDKFSMKEERMETFYNLMNDLDYEMLKESTENMLKDITYPPVVADFRKAYQEVWEIERDRKDTLNNIYERMKGIWAFRKNEDSEKGTMCFVTFVLSFPKDKQIDIAQQFLEATQDYMKKAQEEKNDDMLRFDDFIEKMVRDAGKTD